MSKRMVFVGIVIVGILATVAAGITGQTGKTLLPASSSPSTEKLDWLSHDMGLQKALSEKKLIMIMFYTDWCYYCKKMDHSTFSDRSIIDCLKENFVTIKANTDRERGLKSKYGVRGLPTIWFLEYNGTSIGPLSGYVPPDRFIGVLKYIKDKHYNNMTLQEFLEKQKEFRYSQREMN